jgi:hypothetical protein
MNTHADKTQEDKSQSVYASSPQMQSGSKSTFQFVDNRSEAIAQKKIQEIANNSYQVSLLRAFQEMTKNSPQAEQVAQLQGVANHYSSQQEQSIQKKENNAGLPDNLRSGIENLSGYSMDDVKVHYNSNKPTHLNAHAYAQGTDIYVGSGQEKHLPHEAWHVVQQKQGRVQPTMQMKGGVNVNDDAGLEKEADVMGTKALQMKHEENKNNVKQGFGFVQDRSEAIVLRKQLEAANNGLRIMQLQSFQLTDRKLVNTTQRQTNVIQREETLAENISRILRKRDIFIGDEDADEYAKKLVANPPNTEIQVSGHHRALKINASGVLSSIKRRPPSSAENMRVSPFFGPMNKENISAIAEGRFPISGGIQQQDVTIKSSDLAHIAPRGNLSTEMGGSAAKMSTIEHSEWLHAVAHSLGGDDKGYNLAAGPHSLNTAMIPFETAVKKLVFDGKVVDYSVTFFTDYLDTGLLYIHHVEIGIQVDGGGRKFWTLFVNTDRISEFINGGVLAEIQEIANLFVTSHI